MKIRIQREHLLKPLNYVSGVVERRQTLPILSNVHLRFDAGVLSLTGTDLEVEVVAGTREAKGEPGEITIGARKLLDICRALTEGAEIKISADGEKAVVAAGRSRFTLQTLPSSDFPKIETAKWDQGLAVSQIELKGLFDRTSFAMAQQDVRYYLNGLLLDLSGKTLRTVATDGHRLAKSEITLGGSASKDQQVIVPRKAINELSRFLENQETEAQIQIGPNHLRVTVDDLVFTTKLIDGRFPDYTKVIPPRQPKQIAVNRLELHDTLSRAAILTNEKFRGVKLSLRPQRIVVTANNPEQEEACDEMAIDYDGEDLDIGFNVGYLIDAINALPGTEVVLGLKDTNSSCTLCSPGDESTTYLVMPMRL